MLTGKRALVALARREASSAEDRTAIRAALAPVVAQLQHDLALIARALQAPDPEFALSLLFDALEELPAKITALDVRLGATTHLRLVA
jgi:hypothetical protein